MSYKGITNAGGGRAWGDIFQVNTPYIDQLGQHIYQQELLNQQNKQRENDKLDQEFSRNVANIRDVDTNEYSDKYQTWKQAKMNLMKMKPNNHNQKEYIQAQLDANKKLADLSTFGNTSLSAKAKLLDNAKRYATDKNGEYVDNMGDLLSKANQTPTTQLRSLTRVDENGKEVPFDPLNLEEYKYPGNTVKWQPIVQKATGTQTVKATTSPVPTSDKLGSQTTDIKAVNSPLDYYTQFAGSLVGSGAQKSLNATYKFSDEEAQKIVEQYNEKKANDPNWKLAWGDGLNLPTNALLTPATQTIALLAMQHALTHEPEQTAPKVIPNRGAIMDKAAAIAFRKMGYNDQLIRNRMMVGQGLKQAMVDYKSASDSQEQEGVLNKFIDTSYNAGTDKLNGTTVDHLTIGGTNYKGKFIDVPKDVANEFRVTVTDPKTKESVYEYPKGYYLTEDKKTIIPLFPGSDTGTGSNFYINGEKSKPRNIQMLKIPLSKILLTKKSTGGEVVDEFAGDEQGGFIPEHKTTTKEVNKTTITTHKKDPLGLF